MKSKLLQCGATTDIFNIFQNAGGIASLFALRRGATYGDQATTGSVGGNFQWLRLCSVIRLRGAYICAGAPTGGSGSVLYGSALLVTPGAASPGTNAPCTIPANKINYLDDSGDTAAWSVTVPANGIVKVLVLTTSATVQNYSLACAGATTLTGSLPTAPPSQTGPTGVAATGALPTVLTLTGCTPGAQTVTLTKTNAGGRIYAAGPVIDDLSFGASDSDPADASVLVYWWNTPDDVCIDGLGANDFALQRSGQNKFFGSYHGGQTATSVIYIDGAAFTPASNTLKSANSVQIEQNGTLTDSSAATYSYSSNHGFSANAVLLNVAIDGAPAEFASVYTAMSGCTTSYAADGRPYQNDSGTAVYLSQKSQYQQQSALTGDKMLVSMPVLINDGAGTRPHITAQGAPNTYNKVRAGILVTEQPSYAVETIGSLLFSTVHQFVPAGVTSYAACIGSEFVKISGASASGIAARQIHAR